MAFSELLLVIVFLCGSQAIDCDKSPVPTCRPSPEMLPQTFPETEGELVNLCSIGIEILECFRDFAKSCERRQYEEYDGYRVDIVKFICNRQSPIFDATVRNLKCLKIVYENYDHEICAKLAMNTRNRYPKEDFQKIIDLFRNGSDAEEDRNLRICYNMSFDSACALAQIYHYCRDDAKETALGVLSAGNFLEQLCQPQDAAVVSELANFLQFEATKM